MNYPGQRSPNAEFYWGAGAILSGISGVITFFSSYIYCISTYGFLFGFGLGWLPSAILTLLVMGIVYVAWPVLVIAILLLIFSIFK